MVVFHDSVNLNYTMFISLDLLINVVGLYLCQNLNDSLLEASPSHQRGVVWRRKSFLSNLDLLDSPHAITDLIVHLPHETTNSWTAK